ncbi:hypothetical protein V8C37DRAFT_98128 [Trichoderma ceciliae]
MLSPLIENPWRKRCLAISYSILWINPPLLYALHSILQQTDLAAGTSRFPARCDLKDSREYGILQDRHIDSCCRFARKRGCMAPTTVNFALGASIVRRYNNATPSHQSDSSPVWAHLFASGKLRHDMTIWLRAGPGPTLADLAASSSASDALAWATAKLPYPYPYTLQE